MRSPIPSILYKEAQNPFSFLGQITLAELEAFQIKAMQTVEKTATDASVSYYINTSSNGILIPVSQDMASYTDMMKNRKTFSWKSYDHLFKNVTRKILTLDGKFTFHQALLEIDKFRLKAGTHFYGAVLRASSSKLINPFHILTPVSYLKHPEKFTDQYQVLLYFYSNRSKAELDLSSLKDQKTTDYINGLLNNIIKCSNHKVETKSPNNIENFVTIEEANTVRNLAVTRDLSGQNLANIRINVVSADEITAEALDYSTTNLSTTSSTDSLMLAAHQIMVNGIFAPEYGISLLKKGRSLYGTFLTPSASCNIQSSSLNANLKWASVCTGRESQRTLEGISSLHCSNYASAYTREAHSNGSMLLADLSILKSVEIYQKIGLLPVPLSDTPSAEELEKSTDFMTYIEYMTDKF